MVDSAYIDAELLVNSQKLDGITLIGPTRSNNSWQTKVDGAYDIEQFVIDWDHQQVRCPQGNYSTSWKESVDNTGSPLVMVYFRRKACQACSARDLCTRASRRVLGFRPREQYDALLTARQRHASAAASSFTTAVLALKGRFLKGCGRLAYVSVDTEGWPRQASSISQPQQP